MFPTGDLNKDGRLDFYVVDDHEDKVYLAAGPTSYRAYTVPSQRTQVFGGNVQITDSDGDGYLDIAVADVDVDFATSCARPSNENPLSPHRTFALLRNAVATNLCQGGECAVTGEACAVNPDCSPLQDPWPLATQDQNFQTGEPVHDFAFLNINGHGYLDLFQGRCDGYRVFINTTPPKCQQGDAQ